MFRRLLVASAMALVLVLPIAFAQPSVTLAREECATPDPSDVQSFSGSGATVTEPFTVTSGILKMTASHEGQSNFIVHAITEDGDEEYVINEIGNFTGQGALQVDPESKIILNIDADGPWEISIESAF